ncbi:MAG: L,D-transpeptidase family protein [Methyloligellaceae bacterium]
MDRLGIAVLCLAAGLAAAGLLYLDRNGFSDRAVSAGPDLTRLERQLEARGVALGAPVFMRLFKSSSKLELWLRKGPRYIRFASYRICRWSGRLGPKLREGDGQGPEGFYTVALRQLNPNSRWHRSFNLDFPNALDRANGRTGSYVTIRGGCKSRGGYAMTDRVMDEIWHLASAALAAGQARIHVHIFPFRMTDRNLRRHAGKWRGFWSGLKRGYDIFESSQVPPNVSVCRRRYVLQPGAEGDTRIRVRCPRGVPTS